jgi:hypothetical protein
MTGQSTLAKDVEGKRLLPDFDAKSLAVVATVFAVAFDVGWFSAIDISLFTLFSISEHIVFALRALPVAIALTLGFAMIISLPELLKPYGVYCAKVLNVLRLLVVWCWAILLVRVGVLWIITNHLAIGASFIAVGGGSLWYEYFVRGNSDALAEDLLYWASTVIFSAFLVGWAAGTFLLLSDRYAVIMSEQGVVAGKLVLSSEKFLLVYESGIKDISSFKCLTDLKVVGDNTGVAGATRVVRLEKVTDIRLCPEPQ